MSRIACPAANASVPEAQVQPHPLAALIMLCGTFMVVLDFFIVNVALPSIQRDLGAADAALQLVVMGYGLANASMLITGGRLGDIHGQRRMFLLGVGLFTLASAACGLAPGPVSLVAARVAQGAAGALLQPQVLAMLGLLYHGPQRTKAFGAYGITLGLGAVGGQLIGGLLMHLDPAELGWRSCFLINLPVGALVLWLGARVLPPLRGAPAARLDYPGVLLTASALAAFIGPLAVGREQGWPWWSLACMAAALPLSGLFWHQQQGLAAAHGLPLVSPVLLRHRPFVLGLGVTLVFYAGNASFYFVLALYLQQAMSLSPLASGAVFAVMATGFFVTSMASPSLARRFGRNAILVGALTLAAGHGLELAALSAGVHSLSALLPLLLLQGCGIGMVMAPLVSTVLAGLPPQHAGAASGLLSTVQQAGNALGVALIGLVFYGLAGTASADAVRRGFEGGLTYLLALALVVALLYRRFLRAV